jgi:hypothetical protein
MPVNDTRKKTKTKHETPEKGILLHMRGNQLQVGSNGGPIQPLVAKINIRLYYLIGLGGELPLTLIVV